MTARWLAAVACCLTILFLIPRPAWAANEDVGDVALVEDVGGVVYGGLGWEPGFAREAAKLFYQTHGDDYDGIFVFGAEPIAGLFNVQTGWPVIWDTLGIGYTEEEKFDGSALFGSAGRLKQAVKMGDLNALPDDPNGITYSFTAIELMAHEYGHHWMAWIMLDLDDGRGPIPVLRGCEVTEEGELDPNGHWSAHFHHPSVMYGGVIEDLGNGQFRGTNGPRTYTPLDQYLMGIRPPEEVPEMWYVVKDGDDPRAGVDSLPYFDWYVEEFAGERVDFGIDDVIRANGPRVPATEECHLKIAFILVHAEGTRPMPQAIEKVDRYRRALEEWWPAGTDYRGSIDTTLDGCGTGTAGCPGEASSQCGELPADCVDGEQRCNGLTIAQLCRNSRWVTVDTCVESETCLDGACYSPDEDGDVPEDGDNIEDGDASADGDVPTDGDKPDGDGAEPADGDAPVDGDRDSIDGNLPDGDGGSSIIPPETDGSGGGCSTAAGGSAAWVLLLALGALARRETKKAS
ncbi:MAG: hypothetical protein C4523_08595 [Myxococcales bacterium]|nr:MAG: hypothetical protein C4523_08595 [Myxococcales bacterium]